MEKGFFYNAINTRVKSKNFEVEEKLYLEVEEKLYLEVEEVENRGFYYQIDSWYKRFRKVN